MLPVSGPKLGGQGEAGCVTDGGVSMACSFMGRSSEEIPALSAQGRIILIVLFPIEYTLKLLTLPV